MLQRLLIAFVTCATLAAGSAHAFSAADGCEAAKLKTTGKYGACRLNAQAAAVLKNAPVDTSRCDRTLVAKWQAIESQAGGACPSTGDQPAVQDVVGHYADALAAALAGGQLLDCPADLASCDADLDACLAAPQGQRSATGQTSCHDAAGAPVACAGSGQDGELRRGLAASFSDNGDGTITDQRTGLVWERLAADGSLHDATTTYTWGGALATKIALLNASGFAGHGDWRLPNVNELQSLADYGSASPAVAAPFDTACVASCGVASCSCTAAAGYWSSTTYLSSPASALVVDFTGGLIGAADKSGQHAVRAVRAGS